MEFGLQDKIQSGIDKISSRIRDQNALVNSFACAYSCLLLGDRDCYSLLDKARERLRSKGLAAFRLEDISAEGISDVNKMECIKAFNGTVVMIHGKGAGTVTEANLLSSDERLRHKTALFFRLGLPEMARNTVDYPIFFPRKHCFKDEEDFAGQVEIIVMQDAYAEANLKARAIMADKELKGGEFS